MCPPIRSKSRRAINSVGIAFSLGLNRVFAYRFDGKDGAVRPLNMPFCANHAFGQNTHCIRPIGTKSARSLPWSQINGNARLSYENWVWTETLLRLRTARPKAERLTRARVAQG